MSFALSTAISLGEVIGQALIRIPRALQPMTGPAIIPDCVIEETSRNDLQVTEHPVETGTVISDHAFMKPMEVTLRWSWANTGKVEGFSQQMYDILTTVQASRLPINIYTGKKRYRNMLVVSLDVTTNASSEYVLNTTMVCREIIVTQTQAATVPPQSAQADPASTAPIVPRGPVGLNPVSVAPNIQTSVGVGP